MYCDNILLRKVMIENGYITISSLSDDANISRDTLSKVLNGDIQPSAPIMRSLAKTLKMSSDLAGRVFFAPDLRNK